MIFTSPWMNLGPYPKVTITSHLESAAARFPQKTALISHDGKEYTYEKVWTATRRIARLLQEKGVKKGDKVGIYSPNNPEFPVAFHAIALAGGVATTMNPLYTEREVEHQLEDAGAVALFASKLFIQIAEQAQEKLAHVKHVIPIEDLWQLADGVAGDPKPVRIDPEKDLAALPYSSGTTGLPKGVMLTHFNLSANLRQAAGGPHLYDGYGVLLDFLPYYHIYGLQILMNLGLASAATQVVVPRFDPEQVLGLVAKHKVTGLFVVPPALLVLSNMPNVSQFDTSTLKFILSGAAPLPQEVADRAAEVFDCTILQGYGLTETSPLTNANPLDRVKRGSVGPAVPDTEQKVVDIDSGKELGPGEVGEILTRGPQVMQGYWNASDASAECLIGDGWLRTGDIGSIDEDGYVYIVDRIKEMIKYKGYQVAPAELESVLHEHPSVQDAAVIPKMHPEEATEVPKAFVVLAPGAQVSADDIMKFVAEKVAPYKKVREVEFIDAIPKTLSGKILRRQLIEQERAAAPK